MFFVMFKVEEQIVAMFKKNKGCLRLATYNYI